MLREIGQEPLVLKGSVSDAAHVALAVKTMEREMGGIDVLASSDTGAVAALGDSLTYANISTPDAYCRWP